MDKFLCFLCLLEFRKYKWEIKWELKWTSVKSLSSLLPKNAAHALCRSMDFAYLCTHYKICTHKFQHKNKATYEVYRAQGA